MKKKGYIFIETIVVLIVVIVSLSLVLSSYSLVISRSKLKKYYNRTNDIYLLYYISQLIDNNIMISESGFYVEISDENCTDSAPFISCIALENAKDNNIKSIAIINDKTEINADMNNTMKEYIKQLNGETKYLVAEFCTAESEYYYASVQIGE